MPVVHPTLPADGDDAIVAPYNTAINAILAILNGQLDDANIASVNGTKITAGTVPVTALDSTVTKAWVPAAFGFTYVANNGNKEYTGTFAGDVTGSISVGMRAMFTRAVAAPTHCMAFIAASSQYGSKSSPSGISFTGAFTCEGWIYLNSYPSQGTIISKFSSSGFEFAINSAGQVRIFYASSGNVTDFLSLQSIPLKRWVHVAGVVTSVSSKTGAIYINGALASITTPNVATTSMVQAGDLYVGARTGGTLFFDGYMSEMRIWSVAQSQSSIQANMNISLVGSETNLVALFQGNGDFVDKTSNANTLTAAGSASATQLANPFNTIEYGIYTKVGAFSAGVTPVTIFTGTDYNIPNMSLTSPSYSSAKIPFGFPSNRYKWVVDYKYRVQVSQIVTSTSAWLNVAGMNFSLPTGEFDVDLGFPSATVVGSTAALIGSTFTLSSANNTQSNDELTGQATSVNITTTQVNGYTNIKGSISNAALATWYLNAQPIVLSGTTTSYVNSGTGIAANFRFISAYV